MRSENRFVRVDSQHGGCVIDARAGFTQHQVTLRWVEAKRQWHLEEDGELILDIFNCPSFKKFFPHPNKRKVKKYSLIIVAHQAQ